MYDLLHSAHSRSDKIRILADWVGRIRGGGNISVFSLRKAEHRMGWYQVLACG